MRHEELKNAGDYDIVDVALLASLAPTEAKARANLQPAAAVPDMPAAAGVFMVAVYVALMGAFALTMAGDAITAFAILIGFFYLAMFFAVPAVFLSVEGGTARRPSLGQFLESGIDTATGHTSGADALVQMLVVPALLTIAVLAMGVAYALS